MTPTPIPAMLAEASEEAQHADQDLGACDSELLTDDDLEAQVQSDTESAGATDASRETPRAYAEADDAQLSVWIGAIAEHDERALAALYDATMTRVFGIALRIVRRHTLAEEVLEDTFFQVWRQASRFDPKRGRAITWLLSMARSRAIDCLRREARFQHDTLDEQALLDLPHHGTAVDELLVTARQHADLHRALTLLSAQPRQLVAMAFLQGLSHDEIASQTLLPLGTVKSQIRRALILLREVLDLRNAIT